MHREKESWRAAAGRWTTHPSLPAASCRRHCPARSRSRHRLAGHLDAASLVLRLPLGETGGDGGGACWWPSPLTCSAAFRWLCWFGGSPHDDDGHEARWAGGRAAVSLPICTKYIRRHGVFRTKRHGTACHAYYVYAPAVNAGIRNWAGQLLQFTSHGMRFLGTNHPTTCPSTVRTYDDHMRRSARAPCIHPTVPACLRASTTSFPMDGGRVHDDPDCQSRLANKHLASSPCDGCASNRSPYAICTC